MKRPVVLVSGPHRDALSGVSTHVNLLFGSRLAEAFSLVHFQVGREGRVETRAGRLVRFALSPIQLAGAIVTRGAQIVHLNSSLDQRAFWRDLAYLVVAKACGARVVYQVHGGALPQVFLGTGRVRARFLQSAMRLADAIVVLASIEYEAYSRFLPGQRVLALPNGIDYAPFAAAARESAMDPAAPLRLAYVGRLVREKGLCELLQALKLARARGVRAHLTLAGAGPDHARLAHLAAELGLTSDLDFCGPVTGESKVKLLGDADALVLPSYSEGLPYAVLESMAAGTPVIASRVGAIPDIIVDGVHGLLVPPRDPAAIARAIERLGGERDTLARMSSACRRRISGGYSLERVAEGFLALYAELCGSRLADALERS